MQGPVSLLCPSAYGVSAGPLVANMLERGATPTNLPHCCGSRMCAEDAPLVFATRRRTFAIRRGRSASNV